MLKGGEGIEDVLEAIVKYIPAPEGSPNRPLEALILIQFLILLEGLFLLLELKMGLLKKGDIIQMMATNSTYEVVEVGVFTPQKN